MFGVLSSRAGRADERYLDFVHKLQEQGLPDLAMEYLKLLQQRQDVPAEIKEKLDFELGRTLIMQSEESDAETERQLLDEAAKTLSKFLDEHNDSENANDALAELHSKAAKGGK